MGISVDLLGSAKSVRVSTGDSPQHDAVLTCGSSTELIGYETGSFDLVITDPPFGGLCNTRSYPAYFMAGFACSWTI